MTPKKWESYLRRNKQGGRGGKRYITPTLSPKTPPPAAQCIGPALRFLHFCILSRGPCLPMVVNRSARAAARPRELRLSVDHVSGNTLPLLRGAKTTLHSPAAPRAATTSWALRCTLRSGHRKNNKRNKGRVAKTEIRNIPPG